MSSFILLSILARNMSCPSLLLVMREYSGSPPCWMTNLKSVMLVPAAHSCPGRCFQLFPVGRIAQHEVELPALEGVVGEGGVFGAADDVGVGVLLALEQQVGLADGVGLGVYLLPIQMGGNLLSALPRNLLQGLFGHGEHPAGSQGAVVEEVGGGLDLFLDGQEHQLRHELHGVAGRPVLAGLLVVVLVESPYQVLEDGAHGVVVQPGQPDLPVIVQDSGWD